MPRSRSRVSAIEVTITIVMVRMMAKQAGHDVVLGVGFGIVERVHDGDEGGAAGARAPAVLQIVAQRRPDRSD